MACSNKSKKDWSNWKRTPREAASEASGSTSTRAAEDGNIFNETEQAETYFTDDPKPEFVYENMTLDEIIELKRAENPNYAKITPSGIRYGGDDTVPGTALFSPIYLLKCLSMDGKLFEMEAKELDAFSGGDKMDFRAHRWRVTWSHNGIQGIAQAPRKLMAKQVAAFDLIDKLRSHCPDYVLPECEIPAGALINPFLFILLERTCHRMGFYTPEYQLQVNNVNGRKHYASICYVHDQIFIGKSFDEVFAKRFAAKRAYEALIGTPYAGDEIVRGEMCCQNDNQYSAIESEATHVYYLYKRQQRLIRTPGSAASSSSNMSRSGSMTSLVQSGGITKARPPRIRPPPIQMSKELRIRVEESKRLAALKEAEKLAKPKPKPDPLFAPPRQDYNGPRTEIEHPYKYGEVRDDLEEIENILGTVLVGYKLPQGMDLPCYK